MKHSVWRASPTATMGRRGIAWVAFGLAAILLSIPALIFAAPKHLDPPIEDATERALRQNTKALLDAIAPGDVGVWNRLLEDDALQVDENDVVRNKTQVLADLKPLGPGLRGHLDIDDFRVTRRGEVAVVTHEDDEYLDYHGQIIRSRFRMTDTWIHTSKGWRELGSQVLAVLQDPPARALDSAVLCGYEGRYKMTSEIVASIRCERDGLVVEREGRPARRFKAELTDVFFEPGEPRTRRIFLRDRLGRITGFVDRREARDVHWTKITPSSPQVLPLGHVTDHSTAPVPQDRIPVKTGGRVVVIRIADVDWVKAEHDYVSLYVGEKSWLVRETIASIESRFAGAGLVRIHRSTLVNIDRVRELRPLDKGEFQVILHNGAELKLSRNFRAALPRLAGAVV